MKYFLRTSLYIRSNATQDSSHMGWRHGRVSTPKLLSMTLALLPLLSISVLAQEVSLHGHEGTVTHASSHAPIGVMGDHMHKKGEWMLSYRAMHMDMAGSQKGSRNISPETIVTTEANRFFGTAGQPATLRIVPTQMTMDMQMVGAMFAPTDRLTLVGMVNHLSKDMDHITFQGGAGTTQRGEFNTKTSGWGDTKIAGLISLYQDGRHVLHVKAGVSLPTGSIDEDDDVLAPNGATPVLRLPYAMQLGSGTYDLEPNITYTGHHGRLGWGGQYNATFHLGDNSENYSWGDKHEFSVWGSYDWTHNLSSSLRVIAETEEAIDGIDPSIVAPVQTADPDHYGGERVTVGVGTNYAFKTGVLKDHRLAFELSAPVYQDLNGVQLERNWAVTVGWQKAF